MSAGSIFRNVSRNPRWRPIASLLSLGVFVAIGVAVLPTTTTSAATAPQLQTVSVAKPLRREVTQWDDYVGRFEPSRSVEIRPRVSGQISQVNFVDGALVKKGDLLFTLDKRPFEAALAEAKGGLASAQSDLALSKADILRAEHLVGDDALSQGEIDRLRSHLGAATAAVASAAARVQSRSLDLEFASVRSPIDGRVSDRRVDPGNLVATGDGRNGTLLTTVNALDPIYFVFDASESMYLKAKRAEDAGKESGVADIRLQDETDFHWHGQVDFTDNGLDPRAGTVRMRAVVANPKFFLTPGMFGNMRLADRGATSSLMIPDTAVQTDQADKLVLVVASDGTVKAQRVRLGPVVDGLRVVESGLSGEEQVVVSGVQYAIPGSKVVGKSVPIVPVVSTSQASASLASGVANSVP
ncbi:efflux RND transporter periplasmic adaptor subunit [Bacillus sp. NP157]|nr:efflux RND transporter periplasmic adaptor subunit [Bacillus sp. NP157]